ncbi:condensin complex subunit 2-like [Chenopodium quinoa]|uniref:condensin complex subunit 2-like n=1 Tax=Chenopodium quinoa TaxID=63459 RepID=UPI000B76E1D8|nr:condensin complex subunit 2-like [Chenopodium quinoa]
MPAPTSPYFLGSNDDQLERAAARAARAAAFRRKPVEVHLSRNSLSSDSCLDRHQIMELFHNCVKLASENFLFFIFIYFWKLQKINQKNTWELKLIDHLSEIIEGFEAESENNNAETNFQKASCTLETGVKIYAVRVDAWHADAYRVLNGISRAGQEDEEGSMRNTCSLVSFLILYLLTETLIRGDVIGKKREEGRPPVKEVERKVSPLSTVESSFETLNAKKLDVAFAVDPLYYQTSAQFDEGGAKGLLLCNLGVYGGCRVLFDSQEFPARCISPTNDSTTDLVDVSFAKEYIELMAANLHQKQDVSPSLGVLMKQLNLPSTTFDGAEPIVNGNVIESDKADFNVEKECFGTSDATEDIGVMFDGSPCDDSGAWSANRYHETDVSENYNEEPGPVHFVLDEPVVRDNIENIAWLFFKGLRCKSACNAWAGPDHWTYSKPDAFISKKICKSFSAQDNRPNCASKRPKRKSLLESDIDFTRSLDEEVPDLCVPVKSPKSLLLSSKKVSCSNKLPEDCHYQPEDLVKLFLLPNVMYLGKIKRRVSGHESLLQVDDVDSTFSSWDHEITVDGPDNDYIYRDAEDDTFVFEPRKVDKIEVEYDTTSKQIDVHLLKETLWTLVQDSIQTAEVEVHGDAASFRHVLTAFPDECKAASTHDISPHLCFICLLHLANEHGLTIVGNPSLDDLSIHLPIACDETGEVIQASS